MNFKIGLICCLLFAGTFAHAQNLIQNGTFSIQPATEWDAVPPGTVTENYLPETTYGGIVANNIVAEIDVEASLRQVNIPVIPGEKYYFSYLISRRTGNGTAPNPNVVNVKIFDGTSNIYVDRTDTSINTNFAWTCVVDSFIPSGNMVSIDITNVTSNANTLGTIVDNITIAAEIQPITITGVVCQGGDITLHLPPQDSNTQYIDYEWTGPNGFNATDSVVTLTQVQPNQNGTYTCTMKLNNSCLTVKANYQLIVEPQIIIDTICMGETYDFYGRAIGQPGTYDTINDLGCLVTLHLFVIPKPDVTLNEEGTIGICRGNSKILKAYKSSTYTYQWYKDGIPVQNGQSDILSVDSPGVYYVSITNEYGCEARSKNVTLEILERPNVEITMVGENDLCAMDTITLKAHSSTSDIVDFVWAPYHYLHSVPYNWNDEIRVVLPESSNITLTVFNQHHCFFRDSLLIIVHPCCEVGIPNAFSPNNDGMNDYFKPIFRRDQTLVYFRIFNRYGQVIYESSGNYTKGWDGFYNGKRVEQGVYMYHFSYTCKDKKLYTEKGEFTLIK